MHRLLITTCAVVTLGFAATGVMAQSQSYPAPEPSVSGSQNMAPNATYHRTTKGKQKHAMQHKMSSGPTTTGSVQKHSAKKKPYTQPHTQQAPSQGY